MNHWNDRGRLQPSTSSTRTTSWPATARSCTPSRCSGSTGDYGRRLRAAVISFGATARGAVTALSALGVRRRVRCSPSAPSRPSTRRFAVGADAPLRPRPRRTRRARSRSTAPRGRAAGRRAGRARRRRQLHPAGHRRAADVRHERGPRALPARHAVRRRLLRRGDGRSNGPARPRSPSPMFTRRPRAALLRGRPQPVVPVELGDVGEQRGAAATTCRS